MDDKQTVERDFMASWDGIEQFYIITCFVGTPEWFELSQISQSDFQKMGYSERMNVYEWIKPIKGLIDELRTRGYDRKLRAGQSLYNLVLSRSRFHGLRPDQMRITIMPLAEGGMHIALVVNANEESTIQETHSSHIELTPELEQFLNRLLAVPID